MTGVPSQENYRFFSIEKDDLRWQTMADQFVSLSLKEHSETVICAPHHQTCERLNVAIRQALKNLKNQGERSQRKNPFPSLSTFCYPSSRTENSSPLSGRTMDSI